LGFVVSQTIRTDEGFELQEDGRLQLTLPGIDVHHGHSHRRARRRTIRGYGRSTSRSIRVQGAVVVHGTIDPPGTPPGDGHRLSMTVTSSGRSRTDDRRLAELPVIPLNLFRLLASEGITPGARFHRVVFDPATLANAPMDITVGEREIVRTREAILPAFRVEMSFQGLRSSSWITDTGELVREESPLGLMTIRESAEQAQGLAIPRNIQSDLLAIVCGCSGDAAAHR
jgi:hypothetical protein